MPPIANAPFRIRKRPVSQGFTLVELLVVLLVLAALAGISISTMRSAMMRAQTIRCAATLKSLGTATLLYAQDHQENLPRSFHSAGAKREPGWAVSIAPYLGISDSTVARDWAGAFNTHYRSPADPSTDPYVYSYGLNVHFELDPEGDDYFGSPAIWRRLHQSANPGGTILMGQTRPLRFGDHLMCHQWRSVESAKTALNHQIHGGKANYLFLDCHVETLRVQDTFDPARQINRWNPLLAR